MTDSTVAERGLVHAAWRRARRRPAFWLAAATCCLFVAMAFVPAAFVAASPASHDPRACSIRTPDGAFQDQLRPSRQHWFGTDLQGCDYFARVMYGARVSIAVGVGAAAVGLVAGLVLGGIAGYYGGWTDMIVSRSGEVVMAFPLVLGAILLLSVLAGERRSTVDLLLVLGILGWPFDARLVRGSVLQTREQPYVEAAEALGLSRRHILTRHILPNAVAPAMMAATVSVSAFIGAEAALSYLGIGVQLPSISWGQMLAAAQPRVEASPHLILFPTALLALCALGFLLLADVLRDAFDPRSN